MSVGIVKTLKEVDIKPVADHRMGGIDLEYRSVSGIYKTGWKIIDNETISFYAEIPYGCKAHVSLPLFGQRLDGTLIEACQNANEYILPQGHYELRYHTNRPIHLALSADNTLNEILSNAQAKKLMIEKMPQMLQLPEEMRNVPLKDIIIQYTRDQSEAMISMINEMLQTIQED